MANQKLIVTVDTDAEGNTNTNWEFSPDDIPELQKLAMLVIANVTLTKATNGLLGVTPQEPSRLIH